jgi:hypothetical protein
MTIIKQIFGQNSHWQINKDFARKFGIETTLLLSDLIDKWVYFECPEWFYNTSENIETDTTLSRHQQDKAFKVLIENDFLQIDVRGLPAKKHFKVLENNILEFYKTNLLNVSKPVCKKSANLIDKKLQTFNKNKENKNKENNIFGDTTDSSNDSVLWQEENNQIPPNPKPDLPPKTPNKERKTPNTVHHKCVDFYCTEFRPIGWGKFTSKDGAKVKTLIEKITKTLIDYKIEPTDETILEKFKSLMLNLPDFYKNQDLSTIDSKYHVIFNELKSKGNQSIIKENKPWLRPNLTVEEQMALTTEQKNEWARVILNVNI